MTFEEFNKRARLRESIASWRAGDPVPAMLLDFPSPIRTLRRRCGLRIFGEFVSDFFQEIQSPELLAAAVLDPRVTDESLQEALRQSLRLSGFGRTAAFVADASERRPALATRKPFADLRAVLRSPCLRLKIARFDKDRPIAIDFARTVLRRMLDQLQSGRDWATAYAQASEAMRDREANPPPEPYRGPTHLSYAFDGGATPDYRDPIGGFDLRTYDLARVPAGHMEVVFGTQGGTHLIEAGLAVWLYHVEEYYPGRVL